MLKLTKASLYKVRLPLKFVFKTAKTRLSVRDTLILKLEDTSGHTGFGEVVAFNEPFYSSETQASAWQVLTETYIPALLAAELPTPAEIHQLFKTPQPMALAGLENALCDLYFKAKGQNTIRAIFGDNLSENVAAGAVLGDLPLTGLLVEAEKLVTSGIQRIKLKISPKNLAYERLASLRTRFPALTLAADANQSFSFSDWPELQRLDDLNLACLEEPLPDSPESRAFIRQNPLKTPLCYDESLHSLADFEALPAKTVVNLKIGRLGGLYPTKQAIDYCLAHHIGFWVGSMVESGISKILHIQLAAIPGNLMAGDLSDSQHYFDEDLIKPEIKFDQGYLRVPTGPGLGVAVNEAALERFSTFKKIMIK